VSHAYHASFIQILIQIIQVAKLPSQAYYASYYLIHISIVQVIVKAIIQVITYGW
jgi:hypothetical protein